MTYYSLIKEQHVGAGQRQKPMGGERETSKPDSKNQEGWSSTNADELI